MHVLQLQLKRNSQLLVTRPGPLLHLFTVADKQQLVSSVVFAGGWGIWKLALRSAAGGLVKSQEAVPVLFSMHHDARDLGYANGWRAMAAASS